MTNKLKKESPTIAKNTRQPCEVYSRVVGWLTPTKNWNKGKFAEWGDRLPYKINKKDL